jgi:hypothetical protein
MQIRQLGMKYMKCLRMKLEFTNLKMFIIFKENESNRSNLYRNVCYLLILVFLLLLNVSKPKFYAKIKKNNLK